MGTNNRTRAKLAQDTETVKKTVQNDANFSLYLKSLLPGGGPTESSGDGLTVVKDFTSRNLRNSSSEICRRIESSLV
jgi:hypothetical protein